MDKEYGELVRKARLKMKVSQQKVATAIGVSQKFVSAIELGIRTPSLDTYNAINSFLGIEGWETLSIKKAYYFDESTTAIAQAMYKNHNLQTLFNISRNAKPKDIKKLIEIMKILQGDKNGERGDSE